MKIKFKKLKIDPEELMKDTDKLLSLVSNLETMNIETVDLKKQSGFGPRAAKGKDDQSKELAKSRYEMGMYKNEPTKKS